MIAIVLIVNFILLWYTKYTYIAGLLSRFNYVGRYIHFIRHHPWSGRIVFSTIVLYLIFCLAKYFYTRMSLKMKARSKLSEVQARKGRILKKYSDKNRSIDKWKTVLGLSREEYLEEIKNGGISMRDIFKAFQFAALIKDKKTNGIVQFVPNANEIASYIQCNRIGSKKLMGYVLFVSENFPIKYCDSTIGLVSLLDKQPCKHDCAAIKILKNHGALPLCTTNVAQHFGLSTFNPIYGQTTLWGREVGGESGGAASMIASICNDFAVGLSMDVWGSLRMASAFCGCFTLKPTYGRHLSTLDTLNTDDYVASRVANVAGFLTCSIYTLIHLWEVVWNNKSRISDYTVLNLPWQNIFPKRNLRVGYFTSDNALQPDPGCVRAVLQACAILKQNGHEVVEFPPPDMKKVVEIYLGHLHVQKMISVLNIDLASVDSLYYFYYFSLVPHYFRLKFMSIFYDKNIMGIPLVYPTDMADQYLEYKNMATQLTKEYLDIWDEKCVDVLITPGALTPAPPPELAKKFSPLALPYISWNLMNFPAGVMPITRVTKRDIAKSCQVEMKTYNYVQRAQPMEGLPLSIQIVGRPFEEEKILYTMEFLNTFTRFNPCYEIKCDEPEEVKSENNE